MSDQKPAPPTQEIQIVDNFSGSEYANLMKVDSSKEEFLLLFANIAHGKGRVVGKITTSPGHMKRIARLLNTLMEQYEKEHGPVEESELPNKESSIGFNG